MTLMNFPRSEIVERASEVTRSPKGAAATSGPCSLVTKDRTSFYSPPVLVAQGQIYRVDTRRPVASAGVLGAANGQGGKACGAGIEGRATLKSAKKFSATVKRL